MGLPGFQDIMLPLLQIADDGQEHNLGEAIEQLASFFNLTGEERKELLPSARQFKFDNRVGWARTHLGKAQLLEKTGRGRFRITERGRDVLEGNPSRIDLRYLGRFPEFVEFRTIGQHLATEAKQREFEDLGAEEVRQTPEEVLETSYQLLRNSLAQELLERIVACSPKFFEKLVVDLLVAMGYGGSYKDAGQAVGQSGDDGIDGVIKEDRLGLDVVYIQAKKWTTTIVGSSNIRDFTGSLEGYRATKGVFITTSRFSKDAKDFVTKIGKKVVLIDGEQLAQFMIEFGVGVTEQATYIVKKADLDYFDGE
jgi:restriction system protein